MLAPLKRTVSLQSLRTSSILTTVLTRTQQTFRIVATASQHELCTHFQPRDRIYLQGMKFYGYHGVLPEETRDGQHFLVDATLLLDMRPAAQTDDLDATVNYAEVFSDVEAILEGKTQQLIESVASAVATTVLRRHPLVQTAIIRIDKPHAPIKGRFRTVAVEVTRSRADVD